MLALAALILLSCALAAGSWRIYSNTWDEPEHLAAGVELLDRGRYEYDTEHPPLARVLLALGPWLAGAHSYGTRPPEGTPEGLDILYSGTGHYWHYLTLARLGTLPFLALLLVSTWLWARRIFTSPGAALLCVLLLASAPPILGHGALASLDVAAAATILLALYALQHWLITLSARAALAFGLASGVAVVTKFSGVPFIGLSLVTLSLCGALLSALRPGDLPAAAPGAVPGAAAARPRGLRRWLAGLALALLAALVPVWLLYGPRTADPAGVAFRFQWAVSYLLNRPGFDHALGVLLSHLSLPRELKDLVNGIVAVKAHNDTGHLSYLLGEVRRSGWWYFYLVAIAVKTPIPLLFGGSVGLVLLARHGWRRGEPFAVAPLVVVLTLITFSSAFSRINIGIRHILIVYPFLALGAAWAISRAWQEITAHRERGALAGARVATAALILALVWQLSTLWRAYPDYLPWFNEAVAHPEHVLVDSDLDWGQDLYRLEERAAELHIPRLNLAYRGTAKLAYEPLPALNILPPRTPVHGWVAVFALARTRNLSDYAWLNQYQPLERIGKTVELYYIP